MKNKKYKILTPSGYKKFEDIVLRQKDGYMKIYLSNGSTIKCSINHIFVSSGIQIPAHELSFFTAIDTYNSDTVTVNDIEYINEAISLYDIIGVDDTDHLFIADNIINHNCDCNFVSSGDTVIDPALLMFYKETYVQEPIERGGFDGNLWRWEYSDFSKTYMVIADVARGDGADYSTAHVIDIINSVQVAEYRGKMETKDFGNFLVALATEYGDALLVIENANVGWACIQQVIDRSYSNLFYMSKDLKYVDTDNQFTNRYRAEDRGLVAGFSTTSKTRPLIISKLDDYFREKAITIRSSRTIDELFTFIFKNGRAEAMSGYNDDLVMALAIGLWVRDTALRLRQEGIDLTKRAIGGITNHTYSGIYGLNMDADDDPWKMKLGDGYEDLSQWL